MTADTRELTDVEDGETVKVTQRMALDALHTYAKARAAVKEAKNAMDAVSKAILKPYLTANPHETLYDGESGMEATLKPHSAPRWLDHTGLDAIDIHVALEHEFLKLNLSEVDKVWKRVDRPDALQEFVNHIKPGGEGTPRLNVSKRDDE